MDKRVGVVSLGCDKNRVDTEYMLGFLQRGGFRLVQEPESAQVLIVNTCAFLEKSREEAIDTVLEMAQYKQGGCEKLIVTGCLPQRFYGELEDAIPEVDAYLGINDYPRVCEVIESLYANTYRHRIAPANPGFEPGARVLTTPEHFAYLKIADGCNNCCSYCLIPKIRGSYRSRPEADILAEARALADRGVRELILVAQDLTYYGYDLNRTYLLPGLLRALCRIPGIEWIRLLYCYPERVSDELIDVIASEEKILKYLDIPLQHVSDRVLSSMRRRSNGTEIRALFQRLRGRIPGIVIRTTFIVGYPGETEEDVQELIEFLEEYRPENAGFFTYSREEGTRAFDLPDQIPEEIKTDRLARVRRIQQAIFFKRLKALKGTRQIVLADGADFDRQAFYGRTYAMAPEIDSVVWLNSKEPIDSGAFYTVEITGAEDFDLHGEILGVHPQREEN